MPVSAPPPGKGCTAERCFGPTLINWQAPLGACARDVKVGVVDTGFDIGHPAFAGLRYDYKEFLPDGKIKAVQRARHRGPFAAGGTAPAAARPA